MLFAQDLQNRHVACDAIQYMLHMISSPLQLRQIQHAPNIMNQCFLKLISLAEKDVLLSLLLLASLFLSFFFTKFLAGAQFPFVMSQMVNGLHSSSKHLHGTPKRITMASHSHTRTPMGGCKKLGRVIWMELLLLWWHRGTCTHSDSAHW